MERTAQIQVREFVVKEFESGEPLPMKFSEATNPERVIRFLASDDTIDRYNEVVLADGWDLADFAKNPVVMQMHDYSAWPIGRVIGAGVVEGALYLDTEFDPPEIDEAADLVFRKVKHGSIRSGSVGFIPLDMVDVYSNGGDPLFKKYPGAKRIYKRQALLEWTICPIPANPNALAAQMKAFMQFRFGASPPAGSHGDDAQWEPVNKKLDQISKTLRGES